MLQLVQSAGSNWLSALQFRWTFCSYFFTPVNSYLALQLAGLYFRFTIFHLNVDWWTHPSIPSGIQQRSNVSVICTTSTSGRICPFHPVSSNIPTSCQLSLIPSACGLTICVWNLTDIAPQEHKSLMTRASSTRLKLARWFPQFVSKIIKH